MAVKLKTPPAEEPVTLAEVKDYLQMTDADDDALLNSMIPAVRQKCEEYTRRALVTQTWTFWLDGFPRREKRNAPSDGFFQLPVDHFDDVQSVIEIPRPPLQSVVLINSYDQANVAALFDAVNYFVDINKDPGRVALNQGKTWPTTNLRSISSVQIEFIAGYGLASAVPDAIKQGIYLWIKLIKANRASLYKDEDESGALATANLGTIPPQVKAFWSPYRIEKL